MVAKPAFKQRKRKGSEAKEQSKKGAETEGEPPNKEENAIQICDGEAVGVWDTLDLEEKKFVLSATTTECAFYEDGAKASESLLAKDSMRAVRMQFVTSMQHKGIVQGVLTPPVPGEMLLLGIFESHLASMCTRKVLLSKFYLFSSFIVWDSSYHWFFRLICIGLVTFVAITSYPKMQAIRRGVLSLFEDSSDHRLSTRAYAFLSGVYVLSSANWSSWYRVAVILVLLPLVLVEVERAVNTWSDSKKDQAALKYVSLGLLVISQLLTLYFSWHAYFTFFFMCFFFFPTVGSFALCALGLLGALIGKGVLILQTLFQDLVLARVADKFHINSLWVTLLSVFSCLLLVYWMWTSYLWVTFFGFIAVLSLPPFLSELASQACQLLAGAAVSKYFLGSILQSGLVICVLVVLGGGYALFGVVKRLWTRLRDRVRFGRSIEDD